MNAPPVWMDRMRASILGALALVSAAGCVESSAYEQVALERDSARRQLQDLRRRSQPPILPRK